jgi:ubiquinone/menaquinone biosynthesis C-methylase UbiE
MLKIKNLASTRYLAHRALNRFLAKELGGKKFGTVLDIGAGQGPYKKFLECDKYVPLDVENRSGNPDTVIADINESIPLEDNYTDCVVCTEVLEHLKKPAQALKEIYRTLKPGGVLVLTTPLVWPHHEVPNDFFRYTKFGLDYLLGEAGFTDIKIKASNSDVYTVAQLMVINLRSKWWKPVVVLINFFGVVGNRLSKNHDLPLGHHVVAYKNRD